MKVRDYMEKATNLTELRATCRYYPLDTNELANFYVDTFAARGYDIVQRLKLNFEFIPNIYQHVLFLGHRGSGKSTLLYQLEQELKSIYKIIRFSVQEEVDISRMDIVDLLFMMYERVLNTCSETIKNTTNNEKIFKGILKNWYAVVENTVGSEYTNEVSLEVEASAGIVTQIINLFTKLHGAFKFGTSERTSIQNIVKNKINEYIAQLNDLVRIASQAEGKPILIMFEDLEKIPQESAFELFVDQSKFIPDIKVHMLLTTPIYFKYHNNITVKYSFCFRTKICSVVLCDIHYVRQSIIETM